MESKWLSVIYFPVLVLLPVVSGSNSDEPRNVALSKIATQSTTISTFKASLAVDGNLAPSLFSSSCAHTDVLTGNMDAWWMVDLAIIYRIEKIEIQNRGDCCGNRLRNLSIQIGKHEEFLVERAFFPGPGTDGTYYEFQIGGYLGRYVKLQIVNTVNAILTLCEVQVMGKEFKEDQIVNTIAGKKSTADSIGEIYATTTMQCARYCLENSSCIAANLDVAFSTCQLLPSSEPRTDATNYMLIILGYRN